MKLAVVTTFPLSYYNLCAREMLATFDQYWPKEADLFISLDKVSKEEFDTIQIDLNDLLKSGREFFVSNEWSDDKESFFKRNVDSPDLPYRFHVCRFSHKVFALYGVSEHVKQVGGYDYIVWLDADVITKRQFGGIDVSGQDAATLQRVDAPHSECSYIQFNLHKRGHEYIEKMHEFYVSDKVLELPGWTDCDVFDQLAKDYSVLNLSEGIKGWHVFPHSPLGEYMEHRKGARKHEAAQQNQVIQQRGHGAVSADNMQIKTKNCIPHEDIVRNVSENLKQIKHWVQYVQPHNESAVICSAGESLSYADIKPWADKGVKIITVKHAIDRLKSWGIKPWACVLLDPRPHVQGFVKKPDRDVIYFVASMVDPSVVKTLLDNDCHVVGYHAFVGAGEDKLLEKGTMLVAGGSATATRCIGLLSECLGFKDFHCYGYDLCYYTMPNMEEKHPDGTLKHMEVTLAAQTWGGKQQTRTFWTEGQFLAQAKELHDLYKVKQGFNIKLYGQGIAAWQRDCHEQHKAWVDKYNSDIETKKLNSKTLNEWEHGITGKRLIKLNANGSNESNGDDVSTSRR